MTTLDEWLQFIERQHPDAIALGLERVALVYKALKVELGCPVISVAGTNGKGSICAMLESILRGAGYRTAMYTSPHLVRFNERVRLNGQDAGDGMLCEAFAAVEAARGDIALTYFEYATLAALWIFAREKPDVVVLEVGLGGRLDAVNVVDADCAVLASVGIDHVEYLGHDRESIGREKAGIFRAGRPAVIGDAEPPDSVLAAPGKQLLAGRDFGWEAQAGQWNYWGPGGRRSGLAYPSLRGGMQLRNAATAICALDALRDALPLAMQEIRRGLAHTALPGRFQVLPGRPQIILDVAHNVQAAATLAENLASSGFATETIAVCGMLHDKDIAGVLRQLAPRITRWHLATLPGKRGATGAQLASVLENRACVTHASPAAAFAAAREEAGENDKIVVFGSFFTVGEVIEWLNNNKTSTR